MRAALVATLTVALAGCASSSHRANFTVGAPPADAQALAADAIGELVKLYPPAISRLSIASPGSSDTFGQALAEGLRKHGYAVVEASGGSKADPSALPLRYVVDDPYQSGFYRVMLSVGAQSLTRGYSTGADGITASAGWALNLTGASADLVERSTRPDLPADAFAYEDPAPQADPPKVASVAASPAEAGPSAEQHQVADAKPQDMAAALTRYREADTRVAQMAAKVAEYQAAYARAKLARAAAIPPGWRVQFAAFHSDRSARTYWRTLVTHKPALAALKPRFPRSTHGVTFVQAGPYRTVGFARRVCAGSAAIACIVVKA